MTVDDLEKELAALPDERDVPNTRRLQEAAWHRRQQLTKRVALVRRASATVAECETMLLAVQRWHRQMTKWRKSLCDELIACPREPRDRAAMEREQQLKLSILNIDRGVEHVGSMPLVTQALADLIRAAGYVPPPGESSVWSAGYGSIVRAGERIEELRRQRDDAQAVIDRELATAVELVMS